MVSRQVLLNAAAVIKAIEETLAAADEEDFISEEAAPPTLADCDLPDHITDPFELIRVLQGDEHVDRLEYEGDIEYIAYAIETRIETELRKRGKQSVDELDTDEEDEQ